MSNAPRAPYQRLTDLTFLERCSAATARFYHYWEGLRRGRAAPSRHDVDPADIKELLPGIVLIDIVSFPDEMRYRLVGTAAASVRSRDPTGRLVTEVYSATELPDVVENYRLVIEEMRPVFDWDGVRSDHNARGERETLMLPLSSDGISVDKVIAFVDVYATDLR